MKYRPWTSSVDRVFKNFNFTYHPKTVDTQNLQNGNNQFFYKYIDSSLVGC